MKIFAPKQPEKKSVSSLWPCWYTLVIICLAWLIAMLPGIGMNEARSEVWLTIVSYLLQAGCFFVLPLLIAGRFGAVPSDLGISRPRPALCGMAVVFGVALYMVNMVLSLLIILLFPDTAGHTQSVVKLFAQCSPPEVVLLSLMVVVLSPLAEEMLFRSFFLPSLRLWLSRWPAILLAAAVFAAMHLDLIVFVPLLAGGIGFCWLYDKYHNYWYNVIAHASWNMLALLLYFTLGV